MIFDTHAHYDDEKFDADREALLSSMEGQGIGRIINVSANLAEIGATLDLVRRYPFIYGAVGVHPDDTCQLNEDNFNEIRRAAMQDKIVAIGEIGLDYYWDSSERDVQKHWFLRQLDLARELSMPVIIHSREAAQDTLDLIREAGGPAFSMVMHCYSYSKEFARIYLDMGYYLGIGGVVTFKNSRKLKEVVEYMPMENMLLETDCPYLAPVPFRGKRNSSDKLHLVVDEIARLKGISPEDVERITWENACRFYRMNEGI